MGDISTRRAILLTGGIGSGKSEVARILEGLGIPVYDSDSRTKTLYDTSPVIVDELRSLLGEGITHPDGSLDRGALAKVIFSSPEALSKVESVVHPLVREDFLQWMDRSEGLVAMESAIALSKPLFRDLFDGVIMVEAPLERRIERVVRRSGLSRERVLERISSQSFPSLVGMNAALVNNDLDLAVLEERTRLALKVLLGHM